LFNFIHFNDIEFNMLENIVRQKRISSRGKGDELDSFIAGHVEGEGRDKNCHVPYAPTQAFFAAFARGSKPRAVAKPNPLKGLFAGGGGAL
jgi:hypothetical protein